MNEINPRHPEATDTPSLEEERGVRGLLSRAGVVTETLQNHFSKRNPHVLDGEGAVRARKLANESDHDSLVAAKRRVNIAWLRHGIEIDPIHFEAGSNVQEASLEQQNDKLIAVLLHEADVVSDALMYERYNAEKDAS